MTSSVSPAPALAPADRHPAAALQPGLARAILFAALLLGVAGDGLLRDGPVGVAFPLWIGVLALNAVSLAWKDARHIGAEAASWLAAAFAFSLGLAWRNSDALLALDVLATGACLTLAAVALAEPSGAVAMDTVRRLVVAVFRTVRAAIPGFALLAISTLQDAERRAHGTKRWQSIARSAAIAIVLIAVFGALLRSADPIFANLVDLPDFDVGELIGHVAFSAFIAWIVAGWIRAALGTRDAPSHEFTLPLRLGTAEVTTALVSLNVLFTIFVATQIAWFFGGERFLREHTGLTVAAYARTGFFQMVWVVALVVPVLLGTRAMLRSEPALARRHTLLSVPLLALLGVMIASAVLRLKMYVHFYGLTTDRLYALVFMAWLAFVLMWVMATTLRDRPGLVRGTLLSGFAVLAAMNVADLDAFVARVNVDRAAALGVETLDVPHLALLDGGAVPLAIAAVLDDGRATPAADRCTAAKTLIRHWGSGSRARLRASGDAAWRFWNADDRLALSSLRANERAIRDVEHRACAAAQR